jgi:transcriptional regulator with XRE-family HTH domain
MGKRPRRKPARLGEKLLQIRTYLGLSQTEMWRKLELEDYLPYTVISGYERGLREPALEIVLKYARMVGIQMEVLVDDELDLPEHLPVKSGYEWVLKRVRVQKKKK